MKKSLVNINMLFVILIFLSGISNAAVTQIELSDFNHSEVIDFESTPLGSISSTDNLFTALGITSILATPEGSNLDGYGDRFNSSRALGVDSNGLFIADPGAPSVADANEWLITLATPQFRFGIGTHDQSGGGNNSQSVFSLRSNGFEVGSLTILPPDADLFQLYIESSIAFDSVTISQPNIDSGFGFLIDNLTVETSVVPVPPAIWLFISSLIGLFGMRRKTLKI